jgi:tetratricopeptide (TPR) repeat protein
MGVKMRGKSFVVVIRRAGLLSLFLFFPFLLLAQTNSTARPWWYTLEQGKLYFRDGAYGDALLAFEDARRQRRAQFARMEQDLIDLLSIPELRRLGDSLDRVETYIMERNYPNAAAALGELYYRIPRDSLNNSASLALTFLGGLKDYPEAEYWIGETYRAEGELGVALFQFQKAYTLRNLLEQPEFEVELLYKIADIHKIRQEYTEMEQTLLEILTGPDAEGNPRDSLWAGDGSSFTKNALSRTLENEGLNRFLTLYRYNNTLVEPAHRLLGFYYYAAGRHSRAVEHLMFALLIQNTVLLEEVLRGQYDFTFTGLEALMEQIRRNSLLAAYIETVDYFKTAYYLGTGLFALGKLSAARPFWTFLNTQERAGEWRGRAQTQLRSPFVERAIEMP